jgi:hypothetical protein
VTGTIDKLALPARADRVRLLFKGSHLASLSVTFGPEDLPPGRYGGKVVIRTDLVELVQPFVLTVEYHRLAPGIVIYLLACVAGYLVVTLRTAAEADGWRSIPGELTKLKNLVGAAAGLSAAGVAVKHQYFDATQPFLTDGLNFVYLFLGSQRPTSAASSPPPPRPAPARPSKRPWPRGDPVERLQTASVSTTRDGGGTGTAAMQRP